MCPTALLGPVSRCLHSELLPCQTHSPIAPTSLQCEPPLVVLPSGHTRPRRLSLLPSTLLAANVGSLWRLPLSPDLPAAAGVESLQRLSLLLSPSVSVGGPLYSHRPVIAGDITGRPQLTKGMAYNPCGFPPLIQLYRRPCCR